MSALLLVFATIFPAAEMEMFKSESGYSFQYPKGWIAATKETLDDLDTEHKDKIESLHILNPPVETFVGDPESDFARNINVVLVDAKMTFTDAEADEIAKEVRASQAKSGTKVNDFSFEVATINGVKAYQSNFIAAYGDAPEVRQRQLYFNGPKGKALIITFTTNELDEEAMDELFKPIGESFAQSLKPNEKKDKAAPGKKKRRKSAT